MNIFKKLFRKSEPVVSKEKVDLSKLWNHFILHIGETHCDTCKNETNNCCKIDFYDQSVCICPKKDLKGFHRPFRGEKK